MGLPPFIDSSTANSRERSWRMRAMWKRYFARSLGRMRDQLSAYAARAAFTARSTSALPACATSASGSSCAGSIVVYRSLDSGSTNWPPMKSPYRSCRRTTSRDSGAGAYSHAVGIAAVSGRRASSRLSLVNGEVVRILVPPASLFAYLHEHVVEKCRRAEAIAVGGKPREAKCLVHLHEVLHRLLRLTDAARGLHADDAAGLLVHVPDHLEHAELHRQRRIRRGLAGRRLDEVGAAGDGEQRRASDVVVRSQLSGLDDDLEVRAPRADLLHADDLVVHLRIAARQESATVDDHVDLVRSRVDDLTRLEQLHLKRGLPGRERRRDRGDLHARALGPLDRVRHEIRVDADRRDRRDVRVGGVGPDALRRERCDLTRRVGALEGREVHDANGEVEREDLRVALDRARREGRCTLLERDGVDGPEARQARLERKLEAAREPGGGGEVLSLEAVL